MFNSLLSLVIGLVFTALILAVVHGGLRASVILVPFYVLSVALMALGISWGLSALAVFIRDVSAVTSPLTIVLMFMYPVCYPMSTVPLKIKRVIELNPPAVIIEDVPRSH